MASTSSDSENEIKSWLNIALKDENLKEISVKIEGNSEKGDGFMGDIVFVCAEGTTDSQSVKNYDLVLKCSKKSKVLRENAPVKQVFTREIFMYQKVLPHFIQYQKEKVVKALFNSVPKYYGSFTGEDMEVIVLENMKSSGYELWPKKKPLSRRHIDLIVAEYGKYHATSLALQKERPIEFQKFVDELSNISKGFTNKMDFQTLFGTLIDQSYELLKDDLDDKILLRWKEFKKQIASVFQDETNFTGLKVILHGDCWSNNFMFLHQSGDEKIPLKVAFLDWQISKYASPILDLSYFLFACLSKENFDTMDDILVTYHTSFVIQLVHLGVDKPYTLYSFKKFLDDWKNNCQYGIFMANLLMKLVSKDQDEVTDIAESAESGKEFGHSIADDIRDKANYRRRMRPIVEYAAKHNLL